MTKRKESGIKITDSNFLVTRGSRADSYWQKNGWENLFKKARKGIRIPKHISNDVVGIAKRFNLAGIGFGNWLSIEDRINYTYALIYSLYDLNKIVRFNYDIGLGILKITFGARGRGRALAHYEPGNHFINITRYKRGAERKEIRFFGTGGVGSLAHEYGHFLDYVAGQYFTPGYTALTGGNSISKKRTYSKNKMRSITDDIMERIIWKVPNKKLSPYYKRLLNLIDSQEMGPYWIERTELFARAFEVYVSEKLKKQGVKNALLTNHKYSSIVYLRSSEVKKLMPLFDALLTEIRNKIKK